MSDLYLFNEMIPCPKCGNKIYIFFIYNKDFITCDVCGLTLNRFDFIGKNVAMIKNVKDEEGETK